MHVHKQKSDIALQAEQEDAQQGTGRQREGPVRVARYERLGLAIPKCFGEAAQVDDGHGHGRLGLDDLKRFFRFGTGEAGPQGFVSSRDPLETVAQQSFAAQARQAVGDRDIVMGAVGLHPVKEPESGLSGRKRRVRSALDRGHDREGLAERAVVLDQTAQGLDRRSRKKVLERDVQPELGPNPGNDPGRQQRMTAQLKKNRRERRRVQRPINPTRSRITTPQSGSAAPYRSRPSRRAPVWAGRTDRSCGSASAERPAKP